MNKLIINTQPKQVNVENSPRKLLDQVGDAIRVKHYSLRTVQELLGHKDVKTTMIYTHALRVQRGGFAVKSPLDA